ncbi:photosynthetic NDH subunit of lumenal location 1, chloroplastic isoform X2 [Zingiber officinale]|uniref:photosynthetic NDH subunit of lumenal location 1, chloroplastic isoform X2 n=1 Tax=Zingiber officinale TaxID=94328 RepID=UPI001C4C3E92|nr:photosynthetic NDH subunit of lumenal location 1, chloroplastic isoform X2 [Zingiber officinale]
MAAVHSLLASLPNQFAVAGSGVNSRSPVLTIKASSKGVSLAENGYSRRRQILVGVGAFASIFSQEKIAFAEVPKNYEAFVDFIDGYTYYYPSDWRDFDFMGHDSAFKDRFAALQHVRVSFIPTEKRDVHDLGPMEEVIFNLVKNVYAAPNQTPTIYEMRERSLDGKNYWTFEYELATSFFGRTAFATIAIGNGRYYTLVVGANERRWSRVRNQLKVVADSFKILDI